MALERRGQKCQARQSVEGHQTRGTRNLLEKTIARITKNIAIVKLINNLKIKN
jgi:hypothetical protein